jgi:uncharacterized tellurite resistance protein B-like protein
VVLKGLRSLFGSGGGPEAGDAAPDSVAVAACALLLEIGHADGFLGPEENERVLRHVREDLGIPESEVREVVRLAEEQRRESVDLYQFTRRITESFSREQRLRLIEAIWGVVYADGELASIEGQLARRIAELLGFQHPDVQAAKDRVKALKGST